MKLMLKKYFLTAEHRRRIINALLRERVDLKSDEFKAAVKVHPRTMELAEIANQEIDMLVDLFEVDPMETD